jgi:hypothetical protein
VERWLKYFPVGWSNTNHIPVNGWSNTGQALVKRSGFFPGAGLSLSHAVTRAAVDRGNAMETAGWKAVGAALDGCAALEEIDGLKCLGLTSGEDLTSALTSI